MNENIKKHIAIISTIIVVFCTLYSCGKIVNAEVPANQKVIKQASTWGAFNFLYDAEDYYYVIVDPTGLTISTTTNPTYYYTDNNTTFKATSGMKTM